MISSLLLETMNPYLCAFTILIFMNLAAAEDVSDQVNPVEWWKAHAGDLKNWARVFRLVIIISPAIICSSRKGIFYTFTVLFATAEIVIRRLYSCYSTSISINML